MLRQQQIEHLKKIGRYWNEVYAKVSVLNQLTPLNPERETPPFVSELAILPVSKKSVFSDMLWNYEEDTPNRAASVTVSKVQLNFSSYTNIPLGVVTEIKSLFLLVYTSPKDFGHRKNQVKPNTIISAFQAGLTFLNFVFCNLEERLGKEFVQNKCSKLSDITLHDFQEAAQKTTLKLTSIKKSCSSSGYKVFFDYLNHVKTKQEIMLECAADYETIKNYYVNAQKSDVGNAETKLAYLETQVFDSTLRKASFNLVSFLKAIGETVRDPVMTKHYDTLGRFYEKSSFSKQIFSDYGAMRLWQKGYSLEYIREVFPNSQLPHNDCNIEHKFRKKYGVYTHLRLEINKVYYSALWVVGTLMGARPNVLSDLKIAYCLDLANRTIVANEHKGKDNQWSLFNDHWVAIPIMIDALKVIELIGGKVFQNDYVFASVDTTKPDSINAPMSSLTITIKNCFTAITGLSLSQINTQLRGYVFRHSLAHQMYRADVGLPVISYQLKHIVTAAQALARKGKVSETTLGYGGIANQLTDVGNKTLNLREVAELEAIKANFDPNGQFMGGKAKEHLSRIRKFFNGCVEAGYTESEIYEAMVKQGLAIINVGSGYCFGGVEDFDESLPCIGSLRCNPVRCKNAIVTKANAPKWREIYLENIRLVGAEGYADMQDQIIEAIAESKRVLEYLGEDLI
ncbi:hypothetical protein [Vibrio lentus]|uniref:hypothetical protein n=1 Tax=Vibrio lentus TaxID=136468 RepID=UPI004062D1C4